LKPDPEAATPPRPNSFAASTSLIENATCTPICQRGERIKQKQVANHVLPVTSTIKIFFHPGKPLSTPLVTIARMMNKRKHRFIRAIEILAPGEKSILEAAGRVNRDKLPLFPGSTALEFVAAMEKQKNRIRIWLQGEGWRKKTCRPEAPEIRKSWASSVEARIE
jgi:hypothetical protein